MAITGHVKIMKSKKALTYIKKNMYKHDGDSRISPPRINNSDLEHRVSCICLLYYEYTETVQYLTVSIINEEGVNGRGETAQWKECIKI